MPDNQDQELFESLKQCSWMIEPIRKQSLASKTSIKVGGPADCYVTVCSISELNRLFNMIGKSNIPWFVLGNGTNILVRDEGFPGLVIILKGIFLEMRQVDGCRISCGAGVSGFKLARFARKRGLAGVEFLTTIPGTIGGATYMNAGAHGCQMKDIVESVEYLNREGEVETIKGDQAEFAYRSSTFTAKKRIILGITLLLKSDDPMGIADREREMIRYRKETQPVDKHTWGSVFINPPGHSAGRLIESCGLKGKGVGNARISPKHANFIENTGEASFEDLMKTVELARTMVFNKFGITLEMEGRIVPDL